jgi:hypothetical protein
MELSALLRRVNGLSEIVECLPAQARSDLRLVSRAAQTHVENACRVLHAHVPWNPCCRHCKVAGKLYAWKGTQHKNLHIPKAIRKLFEGIAHSCVKNIDRAALGCMKCMDTATALFGLCYMANTSSTVEHFVGWRHGPQGLRWSRGDDLPSTKVVKERIFAASAGALQVKSFFDLLKENRACIAGGTLVAACTPADDAAATTSDLDVYVPTRKHVWKIATAMRSMPWIIDGDGQIMQAWQDLQLAYKGKVLRLSWTTHTNKPVLVDVVARTLGSEPSLGAPIRFHRLPPNWGLAAGFDLPACAFAYNLCSDRFEWSPAGAQSIASKTIHLCASAFLHHNKIAEERRRKYIVGKKFAMTSPLAWTHETSRHVRRLTAVLTTGHNACHHRTEPCGYFYVRAV